MLTQTALPFLAGALHGYLQPTSASASKASARSVHTAPDAIYRNNTDRPGVCWICNAKTLPGDAHTHTAESAEMWTKRPDWTVSPTPEEMAEEARARKDRSQSWRDGYEEGVRTERGRAAMAQ